MRMRFQCKLVWLILLAAWVAGRAVGAGQKLNFAVVALKNGEGVSAGEAEIIADRLRSELFETGKVNMMERDQMNEILKEQGFQASGACTDEACMVEIGQLLGVQRLVSGSIGKLGSMFLVNFRTIDVTTAKIVKVVSVDIKGEIEDVVGHLAGIADQLVGTEKVKAKKAPKPEPKPEAKPEPVTEEVEEVETEYVDGIKRERNENRSGVRLCFAMYLGSIEHNYRLKVYDYGTYTEEERNYDSYFEGRYYVDPELATNEPEVEKSSSPVIHPQIKFAIRAGRFLAIDVGPSFIYASETFQWEGYDTSGNELNRTLDYTYWAPTVALGVNFVYRIFPLKLNAGVLADFSVPICSWEVTDDFYNTTEDESVYPGFAFGIGGRVGAEILIGPHMGIAADFVFRPQRWEGEMNITSEDFYGYNSYGNYYSYDVETYHEVTFPSIGIVASANFYY
ncbi:MAG: hypothetical protein GF418_05890 [Chitinivibrionales bacterium]|nr:hypothetical protein [Chitinivibrionales bacterium]MBD3395142.1 hypothetical protein [Chitinivibrionales bacterium]